MTKHLPKILLLLLILGSISCGKELEPDYKVVELDYGIDNYSKNIGDKSEEIIVKQRNIVILKVDIEGNTEIEKAQVSDRFIVDELKRYIIPHPENDKMPATTKMEFKYSGKVDVNKNIIVLGIFDKKLNYEKYREIRNKVYIAFNEVRNDFSIRKFGKTLPDLIHSTSEEDMAQWQEVKQIFPIRYMETVE